MLSKLLFCLALVAAQFVATNSYASGSLFRSYLSVDGNDDNPCTVTAPCRLLPAALAATESGGEVWILDSANYNTGPVTITQSVTVLAVPGALGSLLADGGDAVDVTGEGIVVTFRNLVFREFDSNSAYGGINASGSNTQLIVENSEFSEFAYAIQDSGVGNANATITHSLFRDNDTAILIYPSASGLGHAIVDHCNIINSVIDGVYATASHVVVSNSSITGSGQNTTGGSAGYGVSADTGGVIAIQNDVIEYNIAGAELANDYAGTLGVVESTGNNTFLFNSNDVSGGSLTSISNK